MIMRSVRCRLSTAIYHGVVWSLACRIGSISTSGTPARYVSSQLHTAFTSREATGETPAPVGDREQQPHSQGSIAVKIWRREKDWTAEQRFSNLKDLSRHSTLRWRPTTRTWTKCYNLNNMTLRIITITTSMKHRKGISTILRSMPAINSQFLTNCKLRMSTCNEFGWKSHE